MLCEFFLGDRQDISLPVKDNGSGTARALIQSQDILIRYLLFHNKVMTVVNQRLKLIKIPGNGTALWKKCKSSRNLLQCMITGNYTSFDIKVADVQDVTSTVTYSPTRCPPEGKTQTLLLLALPKSSSWFFLETPSIRTTCLFPISF